MKSLQDYINTFRGIAKGLDISGDSSELLIQLLANATYINEVENISYSQEASLERATKINSKIQHCIDNMYSVYRGQCPRVILNIKPTKSYIWTPFNEIITSNNFKVYYLGWYDKKNNKFNYDTKTVYPTEETYQIIGLLASEVVTKNFKLSERDNKYYYDCLESDLSNDVKITIGDSNKTITRIFSEHVLDDKIFDLTLPGFGSRIYFNNISDASSITEIDQNSEIKLLYFKLSKLSNYNESELKKLNLKGSESVSFSGLEMISGKRWLDTYQEISPGIIVIPETDPDDLLSIHYKANRVRHLGKVFKSNSDLGDLLQQKYPDIIADTSVILSDTDSKLSLYYIPKNANTLSSEDVTNFIRDYKAYYIVDDLKISIGTLYNVKFDIEVELYETGSVSDEIENILNSYSGKFNVNFIKSEKNALLDKDSVCLDIETQISKLPLVKKIRKFNLIYSTESEEYFEENVANDLWNLMIEDLLQKRAYYLIESSINQII